MDGLDAAGLGDRGIRQGLRPAPAARKACAFHHAALGAPFDAACFFRYLRPKLAARPAGPLDVAGTHSYARASCDAGTPACPNTMYFPPPAAPRAPGATDAALPADAEALKLECVALRTELAQLRAQLATAQQASRPALSAPAPAGADDALRSALHEFQAVFETAGFGMVVMHQRTMRRCNRAMERMFGYPPGALDQQPIALLHSDDARWTDVGETIRATMRKGAVYQDECELQRRDGSRFWVRRAGCALAGNDPLAGTVWVYEDITAQHRAARDMQRAKELAEQATRMKDEFLANMRHEIRTPMNNILGMAQLVLASGLAPAQHAQVRSIRASAQNLLGMLNDILDLSTIEAGKLALHVQSFSPQALVHDLAVHARDATAAKGLALHSEATTGLPLLGDAVQIRRILSLYVQNAIKFTERGEVRIVARTLEADDATALLRLEVHDTGIGIEPADQGRLFEAFEQADNSSTRRHGGTGLGLSLCKALARLMGGRVGVDSQPGQGSVFWLTLRLPIAASAAATLLTAHANAGAAPADARAQPAPELRDRLEALLADSDPAALDWLAQHAAPLAALLGTGFATLAARVQAFDFDAALALLRGAPDPHA